MELSPFQLEWAKKERKRLETKITMLLNSDNSNGVYRLAMRSEAVRLMIDISSVEQTHNVTQPNELPDI